MVTPVRPPPNVTLRDGLLPEEHARVTREWRRQFVFLMALCLLFSGAIILIGAFRG